MDDGKHLGMAKVPPKENTNSQTAINKKASRSAKPGRLGVLTVSLLRFLRLFYRNVLLLGSPPNKHLTASKKYTPAGKIFETDFLDKENVTAA